MSASFDDAAAARGAIEALQFAGVDASRLSLRSDDRSRAKPTTAAGERRLLWRVLWLGLLWSVAGGVVGVLVGLLFWRTGIGLGPASNSLALQVASWAMFLHVAGALWGAYAALGSGEAWAQTFEAARGPVRLTVTSSSRQDSERLAAVVGTKGGKRVEVTGTHAPSVVASGRG